MLLNNYPDTFVPIEYHIGDQYAVDGCSQRASFYGVTGTPTAWFDGTRKCEGAYTNVTQMYNWYYSTYTAAMNTSTDVSLAVEVVKTGAMSVHVRVQVSVDPGGLSRALRVHIARLADHFPPTPNYSRNTFRKALTPQLVTLAPGQSAIVQGDMPLDLNDYSHPDETRIVVWAQTYATAAPAQIHNTVCVAGPFHYKLGDMDCNGRVDFDDVDAFVLAISGQEAYEAVYPNCDWMNADCNVDGHVDFADIDPFVTQIGS